ncbi:MAG: LPXTG cell wall anchor domain-containing protein [Candidatus Ventricola sp.]
MMKRRVFGMLLSLCLVLALIPAAGLGDEKISLTVPYTITVEQRGSAEPGEAKFWVGLVKDTGEGPVATGGEFAVECDNVRTNGVGDYPGEVVLKGTLENLSNFTKGMFVRQCEPQVKDGWTRDPRVWYVKIVPVAAQDAVTSVDYVVYPTKYDSKSGKYIPDEKNPQRAMAFTYIYGSEPAAPIPDTTKLPKTGDSSNLAAWLVLLAVSAAGVTVYGMRRRSAR